MFPIQLINMHCNREVKLCLGGTHQLSPTDVSPINISTENHVTGHEYFKRDKITNLGNTLWSIQDFFEATAYSHCCG